MKLLDWIAENRPGKITRYSDRLEIEHICGEYSTLWINHRKECPNPLESLGDLYQNYDGMDLFSSTFKLGSISVPRIVDGVEIVSTLSQIHQELTDIGVDTPEAAIGFMYQQGIGFYSVSNDGKRIFEWDTEIGGLTTECSDVFEIFDEWLMAVNSDN